MSIYLYSYLQLVISNFYEIILFPNTDQSIL